MAERESADRLGAIITCLLTREAQGAVDWTLTSDSGLILLSVKVVTCFSVEKSIFGFVSKLCSWSVRKEDSFLAFRKAELGLSEDSHVSFVWFLSFFL